MPRSSAERYAEAVEAVRDLVREAIIKADSIVKDYTHKLLKTTKEPGRTVYHIEAVPKPDAPVGLLYNISVAGDVSGGRAPLIFSKMDGPAWLSVGTNGTVSGTNQFPPGP